MCSVPRLNDLPCVHHGDAIGSLSNHTKVVGNEQERGTTLGGGAAKQVKHLRLDRHVEGGGWLVGDDH